MLGGWLVESVIRFSTQGIAQLERAGTVVNSVALREAELTGQLTAQEAAWLRNAAAAERAAAARQEAYNRFAGGVALVGAATIGFSIDQAANLERSMLNLQIATASSREQMEAFRKSIYDTAYATAQSAPTIASLYGDIASTSGLPAKSLTPQFLSNVTKFAEIVQMKSRGTTHEYTAPEAAKQLIELAHQYRAYSADQIDQFAEMLHKATYFMPGGLSQFLTQSKYFTPLMALSAGNADAMQQSVLLGILLQQTGLGRGRGGTGVAAFERQILQGLAMTKSYTSGRKDALVAAGLIDPKTGLTPFVRHNAQGQEFFDIIGALSQVQRYADQHTAGLTGAAKDRAEQDVMRTILSALGVQGSLVALVAAGGGIQQMHNVQQRMGNIPSIAQDQAARLKLFWGEWQRTTSLVETAFATLGTTILPQATHALHEVNTNLLVFNEMLEEHPDAAKGIMTLIAYITGAATIYSVTAVTSKFLQFMGIIGGEGAAAAGGGTLVSSAGAATTAVGGLITVLRALASPLGAITAMFLYGLHVEADYVKKHPGAKMFGSNYGGDNGPYSQDVDVFGRPIIHGFRAKVKTPIQQLNDRLHPSVQHTHVEVHQINIQTNDPIKFAQDLQNPLSALYRSTRTHARIPLSTSVPPR